MGSSINFVSHRRKKLSSVQKRDRKMFLFATAVLVAIFALFLLAIGIKFYFVYQIKEIRSTQDSIKSAIVNQQEVEKNYTIFANKIKQLSLLFEKRKSKQEAITFFSELFGNEIEVKNIDYSASENDILTFSLSMPDVFFLNEVISVLESSDVSQVYPKIEKKSLRRSADGSYNISLTVYLGDKKEGAKTVSENNL